MSFRLRIWDTVLRMWDTRALSSRLCRINNQLSIFNYFCFLMTQERVLVIGAGGQLGSELTQGLWRLHGKDNVIATDVKPAEGILATGNFETLDVLNTARLQSLISKDNIAQIYHLAAVLSATGERNPKLAWQLNMEGLINVLDAAVDNKVSRVYWPSSIAAFGPTTPKIKTPQDT